MTSRQIARLKVAIKILQQIVDEAEGSFVAEKTSFRVRRNKADVEKMKAEVRTKRASGVPAHVLADTYQVSLPYIYMIGQSK
jgi:hypothetical protein